MTIDYMKLARKGLNKLNETSEHELDSIGNLRVGDTGMVDEKGRVLGKCARMAHLRMKGYEISKPEDKPQFEESKLIMFGGGHISERMWDDWYDAADVVYLCENDIPVSWLTTNGTTVAGRPDRVFVDSNNTPQCLMEHKRCSSVWTSLTVRIQETPKFDHMLQAAHYMKQLGTDGLLAYTQDVNYSLPGFPWVKKLMPHPAVLTGDKGQLTLKPYIYGYHLTWDDDRLLYRGEDKDQWNDSTIRWTGIERFFELASTMGPDQELPPVAHVPKGDGSKGYPFDQYSAIADVNRLVDERGLGYDDFIMMVEALPYVTKLEQESDVVSENITKDV